MYRHRLELDRWQAIGQLHRRQGVRILATHAVAVERAELEQAIQRDRIRDATGMLFDGRYAERDLQLALWSASVEAPLCVAFADMNGMKPINDSFGHAAGDDAIRAWTSR